MDQGQNTPQQPLQPRKSMRIDSNQKKTGETVEKVRRAFEAEEKLKKLAEKADLAKRKSADIIMAQSSIPKNKNTEVKKKNVVLNKPIAKKKIKLVMEKVKRVQNAVLLRTKTVKPQKSEVSSILGPYYFFHFSL